MGESYRLETGKRGRPRTQTTLSEILIERLIRSTGVLIILFLTLIFLFLLREGGATFFEVSLSDLFGSAGIPVRSILVFYRWCWDRLW